jgi:hypothetical protein
VRSFYAGVLLMFLVLPGFAAKDTAFQTLNWPDSGQPELRFNFSKFKTIPGGMGKEHAYVADTTAENLSEKLLGDINLLVYVFDKTHARIGDGNISLTNVGPHQIVKFQVSLYASGIPASVALAPSAPRTLSITINSVPREPLSNLTAKRSGPLRRSQM